MTTHHAEQAIRFFDAGTGAEMGSAGITVVLPDGNRFTVESRPGRDGAAVFFIPEDALQSGGISLFSIDPGASNLFSVRVVRVTPGDGR